MRVRKRIFTTFLVALVTASLASAGMAQIVTSNATIREVVRRIQTRTDSLQRAVQNAADRNNYRIDDINRLILDFENAANQLDRRLGTRRATSADAQALLDRGGQIDVFFTNNRLGAGSQREWRAIRTDLDQLASFYSLDVPWTPGNVGGGESNTYNLNDFQMRQLVNRLNVRSATFSRSLRGDLNRTGYNDRASLDQVRRQLSDFETALVQLRNRVNSRQSSSSDARTVLDRASFLNSYIIDRQLSYQTKNSWTSLRSDLDQLASAFNIAWNWSNYPGSGGGGGYGNRGDLTGTFRLNPSRGDDVRRAVDDATRNLSLAERQRVYDSLLRRLDPPQMIAIDRRGSSVTIASTRAPQINFQADGREQVEQTNQGRTVRVRASLTGDTLTITRTGERANDFTVTFDPSSDGREMLVTRTLYSDRITQPVMVRTYYDRTSDVAQLNVYDTNREGIAVGEPNPTGTFIVPNGTELVGVLNSDLSTQNAREGDRFTMTVRSPSQFDGATVEGTVSNVNRSGRVSGRSEMTLDFDTIRLRDGRSYRFAGILETVRTPSGEVVRVDNEGAVRENDQTKTTVTRTAIGTAVGAIIGAIAGGGKGAAIGAVIGAGAGAGSVYVQGRNDLELTAGTEITVRATGPRG
jgi:hypothetical protein